MTIIDSKIAGVKIIETTPISDPRGAFTRFFCHKELAPILTGRHIMQISHSQNIKTGTLRGMHLQKPPHGEMKLVRCIKGKVWDVAVDLRAGSPTFRQWHAEELTPENARMLVVPEGCAHGFQTLSPDSELLYLITHEYSPDAAIGFHYNDPAFSIDWPLEVTTISERDQSYAPFDPSFAGIAL